MTATTAKKTVTGSLGALFAGVKKEKDLAEAQNIGGSVLLNLNEIQPGKYQPRKDFNPEKLQELADSIKAQGVIQPIIVRKIEEGRYEIIAGERRWQASKLAGLEAIPVIVREIDDKTALAMALVENLQRQDLKPMEEAEALQRLKDEFKLKNTEVAEAVGKKPNDVNKLLVLLKLPGCLKALYDRGVTSPEILNELARAYKDDQEGTESYVSSRDSVSLAEARGLKPKKEPKALADKKNSSTSFFEEPGDQPPEDNNTPETGATELELGVSAVSTMSESGEEVEESDITANNTTAEDIGEEEVIKEDGEIEIPELDLILQQQSHLERLLENGPEEEIDDLEEPVTIKQPEVQAKPQKPTNPIPASIKDKELESAAPLFVEESPQTKDIEEEEGFGSSGELFKQKPVKTILVEYQEVEYLLNLEQIDKDTDYCWIRGQGADAKNQRVMVSALTLVSIQ